MKQYALLFAIISILIVPVAMADYVNLTTDSIVTPNSIVYIKGNVRLANGSGLLNTNITFNLSDAANLFNSTNYTNTDSSGFYDRNVTSPNSVGEYNITIITNGSLSKRIRVFVTNITSGSVNYTSANPPFTAGTTFLANISMFNASAGFVINYSPIVEVFSTNGGKQSWTITNRTSTTNHNGSILYNFTVPSTADGSYVIAVDRGALKAIVVVKSTYLMAVSLQTSQNETKFSYSPGSSFNIIAKIRDTNKNPIGYAVNVTAMIKRPDGSSESVTLSNDTTTDGQYKYTNYTTNSSLSGNYDIRVSALVGSATVQGSTIVTTMNFETQLETQAEFFREWGGSTSFPTSGTVGLNVVVTNLSSGSTLTGALNPSDNSQANCSSINSSIRIFKSNGTEITINPVGKFSDAGGFDFGKTVCRIQFMANETSDNYKVTYNVTVGPGVGENVTGTGYFSAQKYVIKPSPVSSLGGSFDFITMLYPGDNVTFEIGAFDILSNTELIGLNITNIRVTKIIPLEFISGSTAITNNNTVGTSNGFNVSQIVSGTATRNPSVTVTLPINRTGPYQIEIIAEIYNGEAGVENVTGYGFYMAKYIMGFMSSRGKAQFSGESDFGGESSCTGTENFQGNVFDIRTNSAPKDAVLLNNILEVRDEETGMDVTSCLSMVNNISDSSGTVNIPVTFSSSGRCASLSGFYFMMINASYKGNDDQIPAGFSCKRYSFFPSIAGNSFGRIGSTSNVTFNISNPKRLNDSTVITSGNVSIIRAFNFNPSTGPKVLTVNGTQQFTLAGGSTQFTLFPTNFSVGSWPSGFMDMTFQLMPNGSAVSDTTFGGFQSTPYDVQIPWQDGFNGQSPFGSQVSAGQNIFINVNVMANVSRFYAGNDFSNYSIDSYSVVNPNVSSMFKVRVGVPWEGKLADVTVLNATLTSDGWNNTRNFTPEVWKLNLTIPSTLKKGFNMLSIEVNASTLNNSAGETASTEIFFTSVATQVLVGQEEGMMMQSFVFNQGNQLDFNNTLNNQYGWNMTNISTELGVEPKSGLVCLRNELNVTWWGNGSSALSYEKYIDTNERIIVIDNATSGVYDTVIVRNTTNGSAYRMLREGQLLSNTSSALYLWDIVDCGYVKWVSPGHASGTNAYAGSYQKNTNFTIPYVVKKTSVAIANANVSINGVAKQFESSGSSGGSGFDKKLTLNTDYKITDAVTDSNGVAFPAINISVSGSYMIFWKATINGVEDIASFKSQGFGGGPEGGGDKGTQVEVRNYEIFGNSVIPVRGNKANAVISLTNTTTVADQSLSLYGIRLSDGNTTLNGTFNESSVGQMVTTDGGNYVYHILFNFTTFTNSSTYNATTLIIGTSANLTNATVQNDVTSSSYQLSGKSYRISAYRPNTTANGTHYLALFDGSTSNDFNVRVTNATQNVTVSVCAQSFAKPSVGVQGASVYMYTESYGMGGATQTPLNWFDPINETLYTFGTNNATTGPSGCVALEVYPSAGWSNFMPTGVKATLTHSSGNESAYVTSVMRIG